MVNKKLNVFLFSAWYPTEFDPLAGNFVQNHARVISEHAHVTVIHPYEDITRMQKQKFCKSEKVSGNLVEIKIRFRGCSSKNFVGKFSRFIFKQKAYAKGITYAVKKYGLPDIVHVNILTRTVLPALYLKWKYNIPYIITEHWSRYLPEDNTYKGFIRKRFTRYAVKNAIGVTVVSSHLWRAMHKHRLHNNRYYIVPNVVDEDLFFPVEIKKDKKCILHVSGLGEREKNISGIIRVMERLAAIRTDFELIIIGNKNNQVFTRDMAKYLGLLDKYIFVYDELPNNQLPYFFNYSDFHLLFSNYETQGVVLVESFACGKPVIATRTGGMLDLVKSNVGVLVNPKDEDELLHAILYMLDNYQNFDANYIREYAVNMCGKKKVGNLFLEIYRECLLVANGTCPDIYYGN